MGGAAVRGVGGGSKAGCWRPLAAFELPLHTSEAIKHTVSATKTTGQLRSKHGEPRGAPALAAALSACLSRLELPPEGLRGRAGTSRQICGCTWVVGGPRRAVRSSHRLGGSSRGQKQRGRPCRLPPTAAATACCRPSPPTAGRLPAHPAPPAPSPRRWAPSKPPSAPPRRPCPRTPRTAASRARAARAARARPRSAPATSCCHVSHQPWGVGHRSGDVDGVECAAALLGPTCLGPRLPNRPATPPHPAQPPPPPSPCSHRRGLGAGGQGRPQKEERRALRGEWGWCLHLVGHAALVRCPLASLHLLTPRLTRFALPTGRGRCQGAGRTVGCWLNPTQPPCHAQPNCHVPNMQLNTAFTAASCLPSSFTLLPPLLSTPPHTLLALTAWRQLYIATMQSAARSSALMDALVGTKGLLK